MSFLDLIFGSSLKPRYSVYLNRDQAKAALLPLVKDKFVFGDKLASEIIEKLKNNSQTSKLVYGHDIISRLRETELIFIVNLLYQNNYFSSAQFKNSSEVVQRVLRNIRDREKSSLSAPAPKSETPPPNDLDTLVAKELERPASKLL